MVDFNVPDTNGGTQSITVDTGEILFVLGANGSGKSSLMQRLFTQHKNNAKRISAHRQTWFTTNTLDFTPTSRKQTGRNINNADLQEAARWKDDYGSQRSSAAIFDLINADNVRSRKIAETIDLGALEVALATKEGEKTPHIVTNAMEAKKIESPIKVLNDVLKTANLPIDIFIENDEQIFAKKLGGNPYSIAELSDGERNALLITANVLTADPGMVIIIDEPERHLHRSIISPLLSTLFQKRTDCIFVISTHDVNLPLDNEEATTLLIRSCTWSGNSATGWDTDLLESNANVPEDIKRAILGARRTVLFVEGNDNSSLDKQIYEILFPKISIAPKDNCIEVERAVKGVRSTESLNWVTSFGLIDVDNRTPEQLEALKSAGIYGLGCYSVESLYYHPEMISRLAVIQAQVTGEDANMLETGALDAALAKFMEHKNHLCARMVEREVRNNILNALPAHEYIAENSVFTIQEDLQSLLEQEYEKFDALMEANDARGLIQRYPLKVTGALREIALKLGFRKTDKYEMAARKMLVDDEKARTVMKGLLGELAAELT